MEGRFSSGEETQRERERARQSESGMRGGGFLKVSPVFLKVSQEVSSVIIIIIIIIIIIVIIITVITYGYFNHNFRRHPADEMTAPSRPRRQGSARGRQSAPPAR